MLKESLKLFEKNLLIDILFILIEIASKHIVEEDAPTISDLRYMMD